MEMPCFQLFEERLGPLAVGCVNEVNAEPRERLQYTNGFVPVFWLTPNTFSGDAHGAKTDSIYCKVVPKLICIVIGDCQSFIASYISHSAQKTLFKIIQKVISLFDK